MDGDLSVIACINKSKKKNPYVVMGVMNMMMVMDTSLFEHLVVSSGAS